ncbi:hypothetical protein [Streptomyces radicis]|nr:hypothetical protein [Streptomyces radicis]
MTLFREAMPQLADQLDEQVRRGRPVSEAELRQEAVHQERTFRLATSRFSPLGKGDATAVPYSGEQRLEIVREALLTLAEAMYATRKAVLDTAYENGMEPEAWFGDPELESLWHVDLRAETDEAEAALGRVRFLFEGDDL